MKEPEAAPAKGLQQRRRHQQRQRHADRHVGAPGAEGEAAHVGARRGDDHLGRGDREDSEAETLDDAGCEKQRPAPCEPAGEAGKRHRHASRNDHSPRSQPVDEQSARDAEHGADTVERRCDEPGNDTGHVEVGLQNRQRGRHLAELHAHDVARGEREGHDIPAGTRGRHSCADQRGEARCRWRKRIRALAARGAPDGPPPGPRHHRSAPFAEPLGMHPNVRHDAAFDTTSFPKRSTASRVSRTSSQVVV